MFITNEMSPGKMLAQLLSGRRVRPPETAAFVELRHDRDLCPRFKDQVKVMLDVYRAYGHEVHDIQGMGDDGVDVLMEYEDESGAKRRAGLQIKSEDEFRRWERDRNPLLKDLKAQYAMALNNVQIDDYYVLLCVNAVRHQTRIRTICSEMKTFARCTVVEPEDLLDLYEMSPADLWARATRFLCHDDRVLTAAIEEADAEEPDVAFFLITLVCLGFGSQFELTNQTLYGIWSDWEEFAGDDAGPRDRVAQILSSLVGGGVVDDDEGLYSLVVSELPTALCALYFDLRVRVSDSTTDLREQILSLVELKSRIGAEDSDPSIC